MAANGISDKTSVRLPLALLLGMGIALVSGTLSAAMTLLSRQQALVAEITAQRREDLKHYVTMEDWLNWREQTRARTDQQFYELSGAIHELQRQVEARRARP